MPIYEYLCPCGHHADIHLPVDHEQPVCPHCDTKMKLILNPPAIRFEGTGWQTRKPVKEGEK